MLLYPVPISSDPVYLDLGRDTKIIFGNAFFSLFSNVVSSVRMTGGNGAGVQLEPAGIQGGYIANDYLIIPFLLPKKLLTLLGPVISLMEIDFLDGSTGSGSKYALPKISGISQ